MPTSSRRSDGPHLLLIDKPGASSGCACGGATDTSLPRVAGDLEWLRWQEVDVERVDPLARPAVLREVAAVREHIEAHGYGSLPLVLVDGVVIHDGDYPTRDELARACRLHDGAPAAETARGVGA
jgi:hypothetical protein